MKYFVEVVWNREFDFVRYGEAHDTIHEAALSAEDIQSSGDGARVKKARVVDDEGRVVWAYGKIVKRGEEWK